MTIHHSLPTEMRLALCIGLFLGLPAAAQEQKPVEPPKPAAQEQRPPAPIAMPHDPSGPFVRRISVGANFSFLAQPSMPNDSFTQTVASDLSIESKTTAQKRRFGGGIVVQTAVTPRLAIASGLSFRMLNFYTADITYVGVDDTTTTDVDERTATLKETTTRARLMDVPVLLRYYNKDHSRRGRRYFYEGGMTLRYVHGIHSFGTVTDQSGTETCCDETSLAPSRRLLPGFTAGAGFQFIDEFGIRFVPEVRYTRWMGRTFDTMTGRSRPDQLEVGFSVTF
jgi:hypothetical protein